MTESCRIPAYRNDISDFVADLRSHIFASQDKAAGYFNVHRSTITRYESGKHAPSLGYLACLAQLYLSRLDLENETELSACRQQLLQEVNKAVRYEIRDIPFKDWRDLCQVAAEYSSKQQGNHEPDPAARAVDDPPPLFSHSPTSPAEAPLLSHFYVERPVVQQALLDKVRRDHLPALVLWGPGGAGKTTLAAWLAKMLAEDFPDGQIWIEIGGGIQSAEAVAEAQFQIARRFNVSLEGTSPAERAGQLRTLFVDKRCLLIVDDVWTTTDLSHLRITNEQSRLLLTTRYRKTADTLEIPFVRVGRMTLEEGLALLTRWAEYPVTATELAQRLGSLPLALKLCGAQLRDGDTPADVLAYLGQDDIDLSRLDLDDPQDGGEGLAHCFDRSFNRLTAEEQHFFGQLSCFVDHFTLAGGARIGALSLDETRRQMRRLRNLALLERTGDRYNLHPLLRDYAQQKLAASPDAHQATRRRHTAYHIRSYLYHPQVVDGVAADAPDLDRAWADIVAGVKWAAAYDPPLAAQAALLAHTERPALVEAVGGPLVEAVETYLAEAVAGAAEQALWSEALGDLYLLSHAYDPAQTAFEQAGVLWQAAGQGLAGCQAQLRVAGVQLLRQNREAAAKTARQAQSLLQTSLPLAPGDLPQAKRLFYWFNMIYTPLTRWADLEEADIVALVQLADQTAEPLLKARSLHIYVLWCTTPTAPRPRAARRRGRTLALEAYCLWQACARPDRADDEISLAQYWLTNRYSRRTAARFARRRSRTTPRLDLAQVRLIKDEGIRWWLKADETQRVKWLSSMLPRYLNASNRPHHPNSGPLPALKPESRAYRWVTDILNIGMLGGAGRRLMTAHQPPAHHILNGPEQRVLSGQKVLALSGDTAEKLVRECLEVLDSVGIE